MGPRKILLEPFWARIPDFFHPVAQVESQILLWTKSSSRSPKRASYPSKKSFLGAKLLAWESHEKVSMTQIGSKVNYDKNHRLVSLMAILTRNLYSNHDICVINLTVEFHNFSKSGLWSKIRQPFTEIWLVFQRQLLKVINLITFG
jgi:hypothetical protein